MNESMPESHAIATFNTGFKLFTHAYIGGIIDTDRGRDDDTKNIPPNIFEFMAVMSPKMKSQIMNDCGEFYSANFAMIKRDYDRAGIDFWLTRNRHGAGFWDSPEHWEDDGDILSDAARKFHEVYIFEQDGLFHMERN